MVLKVRNWPSQNGVFDSRGKMYGIYTPQFNRKYELILFRGRKTILPPNSGAQGCTASGKSTLCDAIVARQGGIAAVAVVTLDDFWWKDESRLPRLSDEWLAANPNMARLKQHDTNVPAAVDWAAAEAHVRAAIAEATAAGVQVLIVEGFLLFSQPQLVALLDRGVYLTVDDSEKPTLMMRKFQRNGE